MIKHLIITGIGRIKENEKILIMETKKYKLTEEIIKVDDSILYRIEALRDFSGVEKGDKGGFIENENNLSQSGNCWGYDNAKVFGNAEIYGNARVFDNAEIGGDAKVESAADYIVFKNWWSSGRYFTWTRSNNMWKVGCFYGTGEELIEKAYKDSVKSGSEYEKIVRYSETVN